VQRNRVKRLVREAIRINQALVPDGLDIVVVAKRGLEVKRLTLGLVEEDLLPLLERIEKDFAHGEHTLPERSH
jgi:ribonuclease P protein component